jgi:hypothetical protein
VNREAWLAQLTDRLRPLFDQAGLPLPEDIYVSTGWPSTGGLGRKKRIVGEHWDGKASKDGRPHIFISPVLADTLEVAGTLVHELIHAALPDAKHGPKFVAAMRKVGLEGKPTDGGNRPGETLTAQLQQLLEVLGPYPSAPLLPPAKLKPQTTRMLKVTCPKHPEFVVRASRKVIDLGLPLCGLCVKETLLDAPPLMEAEIPEEENEPELSEGA